MQFYNLLFIFNNVEDKTQLVTVAAYVMLGAALIAAIVLFLGKNKMRTSEIVFAGISLACSFILSYIKVAPVPNGGSVTFASLVPLLIYSYYFGFSRGLITGLIYGLLQFIQSPYILTPATFALDYILAFLGIAFMSLPSKIIKNQPLNIFLGVTFVYLFRFVMHFLSGLVYFKLNAIWVDLPTTNAAIYSLLYQVVYLLPDWIIASAVLLTLYKTNVLNKILPSFIKNR